MPSGTVKWFNNAKGYGFIVPEGGGEDLFAHFSAVNMDGYKTLSAGDQVQFDITVGDKGPQATNIVSSAAGSQESAAPPTTHNEHSNPADTESE
jgi:CspA family cold shock protein